MSRYVISANRLSDGLVVFYTSDGTWSENVDHAVVVDDAQSPELDAASAQGTEIVGAYAVEAEETDAGLRPVRMRERIRLNGPTIDFKRSA